MTVLAPSLPVPVSPVVAPTVADVLRRAAYLFEEGIVEWGQGCMDGETVCIGGAVARAWMEFHGSFPLFLWHKHAETSGTAYNLPALLDLDAPAVWNDAPGRTKAEVVARLRSAADAVAG